MVSVEAACMLTFVDGNVCCVASLQDCWCLELAKVGADISIHGDKPIGVVDVVGGAS